MDLIRYREQREKFLKGQPHYRTLCPTCVQPDFSCYCPFIEKFDCKIEFVILIHPIELRRRIATGRMSHLCLQSSHLIAGQDYTRDKQVNELIANEQNQCLILYPRGQTQNLTPLDYQQRDSLFDKQKKLVLFVVDGTWATARKMVRQSQNLSSLPRICFTPEKESNFRVRKQPVAGYYSTIEAIHHTIELVGPHCGFSVESREHDKLLKVFDRMVERQLYFLKRSQEDPSFCHYRQHKKIAV